MSLLEDFRDLFRDDPPEDPAIEPGDPDPSFDAELYDTMSKISQAEGYIENLKVFLDESMREEIRGGGNMETAKAYQALYDKINGELTIAKGYQDGKREGLEGY